MTQGTQTRTIYQPREVVWVVGGWEVQEGGDVCISIADLC